MKIYPINSVYNSGSLSKKSVLSNKADNNVAAYKNTSFKGDRGAVLGVIGGFLTGVGATAIIVATGGLAGVVAAIGATTTAVAGGAACTHLGGIIGSAIEENIDHKDD